MRRTLLIIALLAFDAFAFMRGLHPHVSSLYRACYIQASIRFPTCVELQRKGITDIPAPGGDMTGQAPPLHRPDARLREHA